MAGLSVKKKEKMSFKKSATVYNHKIYKRNL